MRIAVVQLGYDDDESFDARVDRVAGLVAEQAGHDLVVLPELWGADRLRLHPVGRARRSRSTARGPRPWRMPRARRP